DYGVKPNTGENASKAIKSLINELKDRKDTSAVTIVFPKGRYDFYEEDAFEREYYISNHDQDNPKKVGLALEKLSNVTVDGQGSDFIFHGQMIPISIVEGSHVKLKNLAIDFEYPAFRQLEITKVNKDDDEIIATLYPEDQYRIDDDKLVVLME